MADNCNYAEFHKRAIISLPVIILSLLQIYLSHQPNLDIPPLGITWGDKLLHAGFFFIYGITAVFAFNVNFLRWSNKKIMIAVLILGAVFGAADEFHQSYIPGRDADILDWLADIIGLSLSLLTINKINNLLQKFNKREENKIV